MALESLYAPVREAGNGVKTAFTFDFKIFNTSDIVAGKVDQTTSVETPGVLGVDFTVEINTITDGGTVNWVVAPTSDQDSFIRREMALTQLADIPSNNIFREVQIENALDKCMMVCQQLQAQIDRAILVSETSTSESPSADDIYADITAAEAAASASAAAASASASSASSSASTATTQAGLATAAAASIPSISSILNSVYPVGSYYFNDSNSANPAALLGIGTWVAVEERVLVGYKAGSAEFGTAGGEYGAKTVTSSNHQHQEALGYTSDGPTYGYDGSNPTPYGAGDSMTINPQLGQTGVSKTGNHAKTSSAGSESLSILQSSRTVYMWRRTA